MGLEGYERFDVLRQTLGPDIKRDGVNGDSNLSQ